MGLKSWHLANPNSQSTKFGEVRNIFFGFQLKCFTLSIDIFAVYSPPKDLLAVALQMLNTRAKQIHESYYRHASNREL